MLKRFVTIPILSIVLGFCLESTPGTRAQTPPPPLPATPPVPAPVTPPAPAGQPSGTGATPPASIVEGVDPTKDNLERIQGYQACVPKDQAGYRDHSCRIQIWRTNPIAPATMTLPKGTDVYIELFNSRQNENVIFTLATGKLAPHDIGAAALQNSIPGLQTIIATQPLPGAGGTTKPQIMDDQTPTKQSPPDEIEALTSSLEARQHEISVSTNSVLTAVQTAAAAMTCLSNYEKFDESASPVTCSQAHMLSYDAFPAAKARAIELTTAATAMPLRVVDVSDLDTVIKNFYLTCLGYFPQMAQNQNIGRSACRIYSEKLSTQEALLDTAISDIQKAQDALIQNVQTLTYWADSSKPTVIYKYKAQQNTSMQVTIAGTEVVSKVASPIAVVNITVNATPWAVSTGISFSNLRSNSYAPVPAYANGAPVVNGSGVAEVTVGGTSSDFSVIAPLALFSYRINPISHANWEVKCPNNCAFLLSAGIGANLSTKSADFDVGPSFQIGGVLVTPTVHWGRDTRLAGGFYVNEPLGTGAPMTLPTDTVWVTKGGIALTYTIPIP